MATRVPRHDARAAAGATDATATDVLVVGGGIVGLTLAWRAARRGLRVTVCDPSPGDGASFAAAGMLAAASEAEFGETGLARLGIASAGLWPQFAAELERDSGATVGYLRSGSLTLAYDSGDAAQGRRILGLQSELGHAAEEISLDRARELEPLIGDRVAAAFWAPDDHQVDPRLVVAALRSALERLGARVIESEVTALRRDGDGAVAGVTDATGRALDAALVVLAAGWRSGRLAASLGTSPDAADDTATSPRAPLVPTRPVKGEILRLDARGAPWFRLRRVVRGHVQGRPVYVLARESGEVVVGGTTLERDDDREVTAGGVFALLRDARVLVPGIDELPLVELTARARPGTPDNAPLIGRSGIEGLWLAAGHYRNGILLTPITAAAFDAELGGDPAPTVLAAADAARFAGASAPRQMLEATR